MHMRLEETDVASLMSSSAEGTDDDGVVDFDNPIFEEIEHVEDEIHRLKELRHRMLQTISPKVHTLTRSDPKQNIERQLATPAETIRKVADDEFEDRGVLQVVSGDANDDSKNSNDYENDSFESEPPSNEGAFERGFAFGKVLAGREGSRLVGDPDEGINNLRRDNGISSALDQTDKMNKELLVAFKSLIDVARDRRK